MREKKLNCEELADYYFRSMGYMYLKRLSEVENIPADEIELAFRQVFLDQMQDLDFEKDAREIKELSVLADHRLFIEYLTNFILGERNENSSNQKK